jgi:hypothetical protein
MRPLAWGDNHGEIINEGDSGTTDMPEKSLKRKRNGFIISNFFINSLVVIGTCVFTFGLIELFSGGYITRSRNPKHLCTSSDHCYKKKGNRFKG